MRQKVRSLRRDAKKIYLQGVQAVDPRVILSAHVALRQNVLYVGKKAYPLSRFERIFVAGCGKASAAMAANLEKILGPRITAGLINVKYGHALKLKRIRMREAGHPLPDEPGLRGTEEIIRMLSQLNEKDLVIFLISGGGSALLPSPRPGITLKDKQEVTNLLLRCGATIQEINALRKHLSLLKGGGLAKLVYPATLISLILSDVIGDPLDTIASGPSVPDSTTFADCAQIFDHYQLWEKVPPPVAQYIRDGIEGKKEETLKKGDPAFARVFNWIVGNNLLAMKAAKRQAEILGYHPLMLSSLIAGETREVAKVLAAVAKEVLLSGNPIPPPACILSGGETTVTLKGKGQGGRNQEFALATALEIGGWQEIVVLSAGTDGTDGPTNAAGAFVDGETLDRGKALGADPFLALEENDSYPFFARLGDLLITGPTGTNVMDLRIILIRKPQTPKSKKRGLRSTK